MSKFLLETNPSGNKINPLSVKDLLNKYLYSIYTIRLHWRIRVAEGSIFCI